MEQVGEECDFLRVSFDKYNTREHQRWREQQDREELLARAEKGRQIKSEMDEEAAVMGHVSRSKRYLQEMYDTGSSILSNMSSNRERIKVTSLWTMCRIGASQHGVAVLPQHHYEHAVSVQATTPFLQLLQSHSCCSLTCPDRCFGCVAHLQHAQKKMLDIINSVGLGDSVLKLIERRHKADMYMALGGMVSGRRHFAAVPLWVAVYYS